MNIGGIVMIGLGLMCALTMVRHDLKKLFRKR